MDPSQNDKVGGVRASPQPRWRQRAFARFGTPAILFAVLFVVVAWMGFLGWVLFGLVGRLIG